MYTPLSHPHVLSQLCKYANICANTRTYIQHVNDPIIPIRIDPQQCKRRPDGVPITADPPIVVVPFIAAHGGKAFIEETFHETYSVIKEAISGRNGRGEKWGPCTIRIDKG